MYIVKIDYLENSFHMTDLVSRNSQVIPETVFHGNSFKYPSDFMRTFMKISSGKFSVIFTSEAKEACFRLMNVNREGIYD